MKDRLNLESHKEGLSDALRQATLCFLLRNNQILLAMKKRGFAEGKWNGVGGKKDEADPNIEATAIREAREEIGVTPKSLKQVATLNFYFLERKDWNQQVIVYVTRDWEGKPIESEEMAPQWFGIDEIPYDTMWEDDKFWLPQVLRGTKIEADFLFDENQKMIDKEIRELK